MLVGPLVPIALCQIAVAPGGVAWLLLLGGETCGLFLVAIRFGICGVSACLGDVLPVWVDSRSPRLGEQPPGRGLGAIPLAFRCPTEAA